MSLDEKFNKAAEDVKNLKSMPPNEELLHLYASFKQGSVGDVNTERPGMLDLRGKAKWDAWKAREGMSKDEAKEKYIAKAQELISTIGLK